MNVHTQKFEAISRGLSLLCRALPLWIACALAGCGDDDDVDLRMDAGAPAHVTVGHVRPPVPSLACGVVGSLQCDGQEDCATGEVCCGAWRGGFREAVCAPLQACPERRVWPDAGVDSGPTRYFELCHPGDTCARAGEGCTASPLYLPEGLHRCFPGPADPVGDGLDAGGAVDDAGSLTDAAIPDSAPVTGAGEVSCGTQRCGAAEQCCVRQPLEPYCLPLSETCACLPGLASDAGVPSDAGPDDAGSAADAGPVEDAGPDTGDAGSADSGEPDASV